MKYIKEFSKINNELMDSYGFEEVVHIPNEKSIYLFKTSNLRDSEKSSWQTLPDLPDKLKNIEMNDNLIVVNKNNFIKKFWFQFISFFVRKNEIIIPKEEKPIIVDTNKIIIDESLNKIEKLNSFYNKMKIKQIEDIHSMSKIIHDVIVNSNLKLNKLQQFHLYYTDNFINLFNKIIKNHDEKIDFYNKLKQSIKTKIAINNKNIDALNNKIKIINDNVQTRKEYSEYIRNTICQLFDSNKIIKKQNSLLKTSINKDSSTINPISVCVSSGSFTIKENTPTYTGSTLDESNYTGKTIDESNYTVIYNYMIENCLVEILYEKIDTILFVDSYSTFPTFKILNDDKEIYFIIDNKNSIIKTVEYDEKTSNEKIDSISNQIIKIILDNSEHENEIFDIEYKERILNINENLYEILDKYNSKLKTYYDDINNDDCNIELESEILNKMLDVELLEYDNKR